MSIIARAVGIFIAVANIWNPVGWGMITLYAAGTFLAAAAIQLLPPSATFAFDVALAFWNMGTALAGYGEIFGNGALNGLLAGISGVETGASLVWAGLAVLYEALGTYAAFYMAAGQLLMLYLEYYMLFYDMSLAEAAFHVGSDIGSAVGSVVGAGIALVAGAASGAIDGVIDSLVGGSSFPWLLIIAGGAVAWYVLSDDDQETTATVVHKSAGGPMPVPA